MQRAEYQATSDRNRAALLAQLNQQGFSQAQTALQQAQTQAGLTAQQQLAQRQLEQPLTAAQQYGSGVTQLIAGYPGQARQEQVVVPSTAQNAISAGATLAGIYRAFS